MKIVMRIRRFDPEIDAEASYREYPIEIEPTDRVLDGLEQIKRFLDGSLAFRRSCGHGVCGSDAMVINGRERLACKTLVRDVAESDGAVVTIEPVRHLPVQRDLMVDQSSFFSSYRKVSPFLINESPVDSGKERIQTQIQRQTFDDETNCILCGACYSACPVLDGNPNYIGPAAIVQASRFVNDSRDAGLGPRLAVLNDASGVWPCDNRFDCTRVCPREIKVTKTINLMKRKITKQLESEKA